MMENNTQSSILYTLLLLDAAIMALGIFLPISNYNAIFNGIFCVIAMFSLRNCGGYWIFCIASGVFFYLVSKHPLYAVFDFFTVSLVTGTLILFTHNNISKRELVNIQKVFLFFFTINLLLLFVPHYYTSSEHRFEGIFNAVNLSVSIMSLLGVAIWEIEKISSKAIRTNILIYNLLALIILIFATRTRTLLFIIPYWLFQTYKFSNKGVFYFIVLIVILIFGQFIYESISDRMNFGGDKSTATREKLYEALIKKIIRNYGMIPYGSSESYLYIQKFTHNPNYSPHNDFLRYTYDWGIYFIVFLGYIVKIFKKNIICNLEVALVLVGYISIALHNLLFLPIAWIPLCLILHLHPKYSNYN